MGEDKRNYISVVDKILGFFNRNYFQDRIAYVKQQIGADGGERKLGLSEIERRLGITMEVNDNPSNVGYRSGFSKF